MSRNEKIAVYGISAVVALEILRHFTWRKSATPTPPAAKNIGMTPYMGVTRRA